jgi:hypothetical protein
LDSSVTNPLVSLSEIGKGNDLEAKEVGLNGKKGRICAFL